MISSQNQTTNTNTVKTSARKLANVNPPSNGITILPRVYTTARTPLGARQTVLDILTYGFIAGTCSPIDFVAGSLPSSPIVLGAVASGRGGVAVVGSAVVDPISGTLPVTVSVAGSLPSSPIVLGGALVTGRSSAIAGANAALSKAMAAALIVIRFIGWTP